MGGGADGTAGEEGGHAKTCGMCECVTALQAHINLIYSLLLREL